MEVLTGSDVVSDRLLSHVASHIDPSKQKQFALQVLGLKNPRYSFIEKDFPGDSERVNLEVKNLQKVIESLTCKWQLHQDSQF